MDLRSPSHTTKSLGRDKGKESKMSSRRLAATMWEINGLKSPVCKRTDKSRDIFEAELGHNSPLCKNKDGSKLAGHHRRRSSSISRKLQLTDYLEGEGMDSVINGSFEVATSCSIKTRLKDVSGSLAGSKEMVKALFRLWSQEGQNSSSRLTLVSALRVEIDRARHEVEQLMNEELHHERDTKSLLKRFAAEKVAWKRREQHRINDAVSSVSRELEIERKLRRQSERLSKRLGKELADNKAELSRAVKRLECERRAREILEQTYDELVGGIGKGEAQVDEVKREEVEMEEKNAALERLRSDLEAYLGGKQGFDSGIGNHDEFGHLFDKMQSGSCQNEQKSEGEEDSDDSELNSIELSMDSLSKSYTWSFAKDDDSVKASADEVFKGRRSLSEKVQWENICLQRTTSHCLETECDYTINNNARLAEFCSQDERNDHKPNKACKEISGSRGGQSDANLQGHSKRFSVNEGRVKRM